MPDVRRMIMPLMMFSTGASIMRAVNPPWPLWLMVAVGGLAGLAVFAALDAWRRGS